jgi:uncharacterized membrane protein YeaQ/YmgE (transglycosylase-associated protein family)
MEGSGVGWIAAIIIGGIAGWLAEQFMKSNMGLLMNIILGIVGAILANFLLGRLARRLDRVPHRRFHRRLYPDCNRAHDQTLILRISLSCKAAMSMAALHLWAADTIREANEARHDRPGA